ncbi:F-box/FBD/LRR-repeat protein [Striga hermonthica]|uniref:F-box/FBD/LRR-repeat protein n=1 Tax=Striga hermonthica TaxID=68872 RepID=A0A9N7MNM9_STRHE|nr:F-box/FBD/LRR-repeat protein [Striga hermonthica]
MSRELSIDRLDSLPDEVICHILSFLPTRLSMSTSVLAKRWRFLWAHVPVCDFEGNFKKGLETPNLDVIYSVIQRHKVKTIHSLRLSIGCYESQLNTLISTTLERNIRNLHIDLGVNTIVFLHRTLFTCKTVVEMRLDNGLCLPSTGGACLPSLKKLHLSKVDYEDDNALTYLLSGCPLLQELIIDHSADETDMRFFHVVSSTIKMLEVIDRFGLFGGSSIKFNNLTKLELQLGVEWHLLVEFLEVADNLEVLVDGLTVNRHNIRCLEFNKRDGCLLPDPFHVEFCCNALFGLVYRQLSLDLLNGAFGGFNVNFGNLSHLTQLELILAVEWPILVKILEIADNIPEALIEPELFFPQPVWVPTNWARRPISSRPKPTDQVHIYSLIVGLSPLSMGVCPRTDWLEPGLAAGSGLSFRPFVPTHIHVPAINWPTAKKIFVKLLV